MGWRARRPGAPRSKWSGWGATNQKGGCQGFHSCTRALDEGTACTPSLGPGMAKARQLRQGDSLGRNRVSSSASSALRAGMLLHGAGTWLGILPRYQLPIHPWPKEGPKPLVAFPNTVRMSFTF